MFKKKYFPKKNLTIVISILAFIILFNSSLGLDINQVISIFKLIDFSYFFLSILFFFLSNYFSSIKFYLVCNLSFNDKVNSRKFVHINLASLFLAYFFPYGPTGDIYRIYYINQNLRLTFSNTLMLCVSDRICSVYLTFVTGILTLIVYLYISKNTYLLVEQMIWWISGITLMFSLLNKKIYKCFYLIKKFKIFKFFLKTRYFLLQCFKNISVFISGIFQVLLFSIALFFAAKAIFAESSFLVWLLFGPLTLIVQATPMFFTGWGAREVLLITLTKLNFFMIDNNTMLTISIVIGLGSILASLPGFFSLLFLNKFKVLRY